MTFTQLEIFVLVAQLRGFTAAASRLAISQSAVSHSLKSLERELGVDLIVRHQVNLEVTEIGQQFLRRAREILGVSEAMRQEVAAARGLRRGSVRIGSFGPTSSLKLLPAILEAYRRSYPEIDIHIEEGGDQEVTQWILDRRVDVGFVVLPEERFDRRVDASFVVLREERFHTVSLVEDQLMALIPKQHALAQKRSISLADLCSEPFIMSEAGSAALIEPLFTAGGVVPQVRYRIAQVITILSMVERGEGISIVAELALPDCLAVTHPGLVKLPLRPAAKRRVGLAARDLRQATPAAKAFLDIAKKIAPMSIAVKS